MSFITAHWSEIGTAVCLLVIVGERIAAITETPEDDKWFSWIHKALSAIGLKFPDVSK